MTPVCNTLSLSTMWSMLPPFCSKIRSVLSSPPTKGRSFSGNSLSEENSQLSNKKWVRPVSTTSQYLGTIQLWKPQNFDKQIEKYLVAHSSREITLFLGRFSFCSSGIQLLKYSIAESLPLFLLCGAQGIPYLRNEKPYRWSDAVKISRFRRA